MKCIVFIFLWLCIVFPAMAQEEGIIVTKGRQYLNCNINRLSTYNHKTDKLQSRLLNRLKKKENKFARHLKRNDSASYGRFQQQQVDFDSISHIEKSNLSVSSARVPQMDSLAAVNKFISGKANNVPGESNLQSDVSGRLTTQKAKLAQNQQVNDLIGQRLGFLKSLNTNPTEKMKGLSGMDKQVFYAKSKVHVLKEISEEPSKAEEQALEFLQGEEGFDKLLQNASGNNSNALAGKSVDELERMGYQTKRQLQAQLQNKLGDGLSKVQQNISGQIKDYTDKLNELQNKKTKLSQTKQSLAQLQHTNKPAFKVNAMRGKPFSQRIEKQFNWQANRAGLDGKPATLQLSGMSGFKHTEKLSYGIGLALITGLGQNWSHVKISFEGLGLRTYAAWQWQYGIGAYAGYERTYKQAAFISSQDEAIKTEYNSHNTSIYNDAVLIGITKSYRLNDKLNGSIQLLYDIWWKEKGLKNPIQLRFATTKN